MKNFKRIFLSLVVFFILGSSLSILSVEKGSAKRPHVVKGIPDISVNQNSRAEHAIDLWEYTSDVDTPLEKILFNLIAPRKMSWEGSAHVSLDLNRYISVSPDVNWTGEEEIIVEANDGRNVDYDTFKVSVCSVEAGQFIEAEDQGRIERRGEWIETSYRGTKFILSNRAGDSLYLRFKGSYVTISLWGKEMHMLQRYYQGPKYRIWENWKTYESGAAKIKIDGEWVASLDMSQANRKGWSEFLIASPLEPAEHELEIVVQDGFICVDKIRVSLAPLIGVNSYIKDEYKNPLADVILKFNQSDQLKVVLRTGPDGRIPAFYGLKEGVYDLLIEPDSNGGYYRAPNPEENINPQKRDGVELKQGQSYDFNFALTYTSPEYRSLQIIRRPIGTIPSIVKKGSILRIECKYPRVPQKTEAFLFNDYYNQALKIISAEHGPRKIKNNLNEGLLIITKTPEKIPDGLYNLRLILDGKEDIALRAVKIISDFKREYKFVHLSDLHIRSPQDNRDHVENLLAIAKEINLLSPEFVIMTGDITDSGSRPEYLRFLKALQSFDVSTFVIPGNHDHYYWWSKYLYLGFDEYEKYLGQRFYSSSYGGDNYIFLNTGDFEKIYDTNLYGIHADQWHWLLGELEKAGLNPEGLLCLFAHYDYTEDLPGYYDFSRQLEGLFNKYPVDFYAYGHGHQNVEGFIGKKPVLSLETASTIKGQYRLIEVKNSQVKEHPVFDVGKLKLTYSGKNDGTENFSQAAVKNDLDMPLKDIRIKFILKRSEKGYRTDKGKIIQAFVSKNNKRTLLVISLDLSPQSEATVSVCERE